jgi:hypothetical protein
MAYLRELREVMLSLIRQRKIQILTLRGFP